jgi:hypothetical protein
MLSLLFTLSNATTGGYKMLMEFYEMVGKVKGVDAK